MPALEAVSKELQRLLRLRLLLARKVERCEHNAEGVKAREGDRRSALPEATALTAR
jgi:hypothetical protein